MSKIGKRGVLVLSVDLRRRFGLQEGSYVITEEREDGILIRPGRGFALRALYAGTGR